MVQRGAWGVKILRSWKLDRGKLACRICRGSDTAIAVFWGWFALLVGVWLVGVRVCIGVAAVLPCSPSVLCGSLGGACVVALLLCIGGFCRVCRVVFVAICVFFVLLGRVWGLFWGWCGR